MMKEAFCNDKCEHLDGHKCKRFNVVLESGVAMRFKCFMCRNKHGEQKDKDGLRLHIQND